MAYNGSGTFTLDSPAFVYDTVIDESAMNTVLSGIATGLSTVICKDGQTTITANIPMNSKKFTGLTTGSAATDSVNLSQVQAQAWKWCGTAGGTADAITLSPSPSITAYAAGQAWWFIAASNNTGAVTAAVSGLTAKAIQLDGAALSGNEIQAGMLYGAIYDGTQFQIVKWGNQNIRKIIIPIDAPGTTVTTGTRADIPFPFTSGTLADYQADVTTAGTGGTTEFGLSKGATPVLTTACTIDASETSSTTAATPVAIKTDGSEDFVLNDRIKPAVNGVPSTAPVGCVLTLTFIDVIQ